MANVIETPEFLEDGLDGGGDGGGGGDVGGEDEGAVVRVGGVGVAAGCRGVEGGGGEVEEGNA